MDKMLIDTKHVSLYINTLEIGVGINYIPSHKELIISLLIFDINIRFDTDMEGEKV